LIFPALDQNSLQEPLSSNLEVLPPADQQAQTPSIHEWLKVLALISYK